MMSESSTRQSQKPVADVELVMDALSRRDLDDLCDATLSAIGDGGGFGWLSAPERASLERYWQGVVTAPMRLLFVARLDGTICGSAQLILPPQNNEAQGHVVHLTTNFIAPWARGHGLARMLLSASEGKAKEEGFSVINLDVRKTMRNAIELYESSGYQLFGEHPFSVVSNGDVTPSLYYYKLIKPDLAAPKNS